MEYVKFGSSNLRISRLGLGAMGFGDPAWRSWVLDESDSRAIIQRAFDAGINFIDTSNFYSNGTSETVLGNALWDIANRDEIVLSAKVGNPTAKHANASGFSKKHLFAAVDASLKRLKTDHVDILRTHIWDPHTHIDELVDAFDAIVQSGKALYIGASTMPTWTFVRCISLAERIGKTGFGSMECEYNLCDREAERDLIPFCREYGVAVTPFSPLARGFLCADHRATEAASKRRHSDDYTLKRYHRPGDFKVWEIVAEMAHARAVSPAMIALAWTLHQPGITSPIFGATRIAHVDEAVAAMAVQLSESEMQALEAAYQPRGPQNLRS